MLWVEFFCVWAERDPGAFTYCARKTNALRRQNLPRAFVTSKMLSYTQLFWTEKPVTSCSTSLVTLTWSRSHLQEKKKKKKEKNINYCVYIYLTNVKGFFLFMCESCESKILFSFWFTVDILFICHCLEWMLEPCDLPCLCELCVCGVRVPVCWFVSLKQYEWWLYLWVEMLRNIN